MKVIKSISELKKTIDEAKAEGASVGFVPTMGYLHKGHMALMKQARKENDLAVVSIYVNPAQFGEGEDFKSYPRDAVRDLDICRSGQIDIVFMPKDEDVYPDGYQTVVNVTKLSRHLCGAVRQSHFDGVATVVAKLFNMVVPDKAYFGLKDYQQFKIIERLVVDLNIDVEVIGVPTVRDDDGLATSSRNNYLKEDERKEAISIFKALCKAERALKDGTRNAEQLKQTVLKVLEKKDLVKIQYLELVDPKTLEKLEQVDGEALIAIAAYAGKARLIDNLLISETGESQCAAPC